MEDKRKLYSLSFIIILLASACLIFVPQASAAVPTWQTEEVTTAGNRQTSMAIDSTGIIHVSYVEGSNLKYVQQNSGTWSATTTVATTLSHYGNSLAVDSLGNVYIVYEQGGDEKCAKRDTTGAWTYTTIDTQGNGFGSYNSIAIGSNNVPQVIYHDYLDGPAEDILKYAILNGNSWDVYEVDIQRYVGEYCSIAVDSNNKPHISYHDYQNAALLYAKLVSLSIYGENSDWQVEEVEDYPGAAGFTGYDTSIALDSANIPFISYYDDQAGALEVADKTGGTWTNFATADSGDFACTDIAINKATNAKHISYYDVTNGNLKYATLSGGFWVPEIVDTNGDTGKYTSIALDASGNPHISYIDITNGRLKHAWLANQPVGTSLTVQYSPNTVDKTAGETATVSGKLTVAGTGAAIGGATIHLSYQGRTYMASGSLGDVITQPDGTYSYLWTPGADVPNDDYMIRAMYAGQAGVYNPSMNMSMPPGLFVVPEYAFGALLAIIAMFAAYAVAKKGFSGIAKGLGRRL